MSVSIATSALSRARSLRDRLVAAWAAETPEGRITTALCALMILGGVILRIQGVGWPAWFTFDEDPFATNAHRYLVGLPDDNDHPPLGKLLMSVGLALFGFSSVGWRFAALAFGLTSILIAYWLAKALFADARAGLFAAAFVAADGFFLSYSRAGLLDGILTCLILWSVFAAATARDLRGVLSSAILVGLAASVKWTGFFAAAPAAAALLYQRRVPRWTALLFAAAPVVHVLVWMAALGLTDRPAGPVALGTLMAKLYRHHLSMGGRATPSASPWYSWLFMGHPLVIKSSTYGLRVRYASSAANPVLFYPTTAAVIALPILAALRRRLGAFTAPALVLALGWLALLFPWTVARGGYTFWYHYLPAYAFGLVLFAGGAAHLERRRPRAVLALIGLSFAAAAWMAPVWAEIPMRERAALWRLAPSGWRPFEPPGQ